MTTHVDVRGLLRSKGRTWLALTWIACCVPAHALGGNRDLEDVNIQGAIEDQLLLDPSVPWNDIDLSAADGIVTLNGTVDNLLAKERAASIARTVKGVRAVVNRIEVDPDPAPADEDVRRNVRAALEADPATRAYEIQELSVDNGHVILTGRVDSYRERTLVAQVVKSVDGVRGIDNRVEVSPKLVRSDDELKAEIETTLEWDLFVDDGLIEVEVEDGVVSLTGTVGSAAEKWRATTTAWVTGVKEVDASGLNVERWARDEDLRRRKYAARSDEEIRAAVEDALARDPRVLAFPLSVYVDGGNVTLRGIVDNLRARHAAEQDARNTVGILRVSNRIKVRVTPGLNDEDIRSDVVQAFIRDSVVESYEIDVRVVGGKVTLSGQTDSYFEKFHADDVVSGVEGVVSVENRIVVDHDRPRTVYDPYVEPESFPDGYGEYYYEGPSSTDLRPDAEIAEEVKDELWWSPFVDSDHIDVSVDDGVVTLRGTVDSWAEARTAIENAYEGGARRVTNELTVSPSSS